MILFFLPHFQYSKSRSSVFQLRLKILAGDSGSATISEITSHLSWGSFFNQSSCNNNFLSELFSRSFRLLTSEVFLLLFSTLAVDGPNFRKLQLQSQTSSNSCNLQQDLHLIPQEAFFSFFGFSFSSTRCYRCSVRRYGI